MSSCENCGESIGEAQPHADVELTPQNGLGRVLDGYEVCLCVPCIKAQQRSVDDEREISTDDVEAIGREVVADGGSDDSGHNDSSTSAS
jgi:hypothetical protein